jgi:type I restriction enzyme S subunit
MILDCTRVTVDPSTSYNLAGVFSFGRGLFERGVLEGSATSYKHLNRLRTGQFVMSKLKAWEGAVAVVPKEFDGHVLSPEFPTFSLRNDLLSEYLALTCTQPSFWLQLQQESAGMGGRRERVHPNRLLSIELHVPPLQEQHRIVDLVEAADEVVQGSDGLEVASRGVLNTVLSDWCGSYSGPVSRLGALAEMTSGPSWKAADERVAPQAGDIRVLGITNTPPSGAVDLAEVKYVGGLPARTRLLTPGSLLMIRTNGNRGRIGNIYRVPPEAFGFAYSAFQIGIHMRNARDADFAYWMLRNPTLQRLISENASGTTGLGNIAVGWLKELELPWPGINERGATVQLFDAIQKTVSAAALQERVSSRLRLALCSELLSGEHEIDDSYDDLLETA